jgi:hypothetical protein
VTAKDTQLYRAVFKAAFPTSMMRFHLLSHPKGALHCAWHSLARLSLRRISRAVPIKQTLLVATPAFRVYLPLFLTRPLAADLSRSSQTTFFRGKDPTLRSLICAFCAGVLGSLFERCFFSGENDLEESDVGFRWQPEPSLLRALKVD